MISWRLVRGHVPYLHLDGVPFRAYFSSRHGLSFLKGIGIDGFSHAKQVHGTNILVLQEETHREEEADGLITNWADLFLGVEVADCFPIYLFDPRQRAVGLLHAGWRGSAARIAEQGIERMREVFGTSPGDLLIFFGPGISGKDYEITEELFPLFGEFVERQNERHTLDLYRFNRAHLIQLGVPEENIHPPPYNTYDEPTLFFSRRRDGRLLGTQWALLGLGDRIR